METIDKFKELIIYISSKSELDSHFGSIKLNKVLFCSDLYATGKFGKSITGATYIHHPLGPAPRNMKSTLHELINDKAVAISVRPVMDGEQKRTVSLRIANLEGFTANEIALVDQVIDHFKDKNGPQTSEESHNFIGWAATKDGEEIPLSTVFLSKRKLTEREIEYGLSLVPEYVR